MKRPFAASGALNNATAVDIVDPGAAGTVWLTYASLSIVTHAAGKLAQVQDSTGTPVVFCKHLDAAAAAGVPSFVEWRFGKEGIPMTLGKKCQIVSEAAGVGGFMYCEGFVKDSQ